MRNVFQQDQPPIIILLHVTQLVPYSFVFNAKFINCNYCIHWFHKHIRDALRSSPDTVWCINFFVIRRPVHPDGNGRHAQQPQDWDNLIPSPDIMLPTANWSSVFLCEMKLKMVRREKTTEVKWTYAIHRSSMEAGVVVDYCIWYDASCVAISAIGSSGNYYYRNENCSDKIF